MFTHGPTTAAKPNATLERAVVAAAGPLAAALVSACGGILAARRLGGGIEPAGAAGLLAVAAAGGALVLACDAAARSAGLPFGWRLAARAGYAAALAAVGASPRHGSGLDTVLWLAGVGLAGAVVAAPVAAPWVRRAGRLRPGGVGGLSWRWRPPRPVAAFRAAAAAPSLPACPGSLRQRFERYELDGHDCLRGTLSLTVPQGARAAHGHVGFCPSFRTLPEVEAGTSFDGVEAVVTAAEIVPWGVRIECRLDEPVDEPIEIPIDVFARSPS